MGFPMVSHFPMGLIYKLSIRESHPFAAGYHPDEASPAAQGSSAANSTGGASATDSASEKWGMPWD